MIRVLISIGLLTVLLLVACAQSAAPVPESKSVNVGPGPSPSGATRTDTREAWQNRWDKMVEGAKLEGKVVIYGPGGGDLRETFIRTMREKYGLTVEYLGAIGPDLAARIITERRAGLYIPDVLIGASTPVMTQLKPAGYMEPIEKTFVLPEVADAKGWWNNQFPWADEGHYAVGFGLQATPVIIINPDLIKLEEIKSARDLLNPRLKGKIAMFDPTIAGPGQFFVAMEADQLGLDYLNQLAAQDIQITRDRRLLAEWVARAKYPVGIAAGEAASEMMATGAPLSYANVPDANYMQPSMGFLSLPGNAPHPQAGALFINWLLSKEGQTLYQDASKAPSARKDIPHGTVNPDLFLKEGVKYYPAYTEKFLSSGAEQLELAKKIFGPLLK